MPVLVSGFSLVAGDERRYGACGSVGQPDDSILLLIPCDILLERHEESLGMLGCEDDTTSHLGLLESWHHLCEVDDEFRTRVRDEGEIGIDALCHFRGHLYLQLFSLLFILIVHDV